MSLARAVLWKNIGYLGSVVEFGSFSNAGKLTEGVFAADAVYFTPLTRIKNYRFRKFILYNFSKFG